MVNKLRYRLAFDLGISSIGWMAFRLDKNNEPYAVIKAGVRIFPEGRVAKTGESLAVARRHARQASRRRDRFLRRKRMLTDALIRCGLWTSDKQERKSFQNLDPYELRAKALDSELSPGEFARALFHLNQRRGFLSNRKTDKKDSESSLMKTAIKEMHRKLADENCRTLGEWLARRHARGESVRARQRGKKVADKRYDFYADRQLIEDEFNALWASQKRYNPDLYSEEARVDIHDKIFFQRSLRAVSAGRCTLLPDELRAPLALPSTQQFRINQEVNNLKVIDKDFQEQILTNEQKQQIVGLLEKQKELAFSKISAELGYPSRTRYNLQSDKRSKLKGNWVSSELRKEQYFDSGWDNFPVDEQDRIVQKLLSEENRDTMIEWLKTNHNLAQENAEKLADIALPEGYGNLSSMAILKILPMLKQGCRYDEAVVKAGFESHSQLTRFQQTGELLDQLPYYGEILHRHIGTGSYSASDTPEVRYGKIANPTVHIALNEIRKLVNEISKRYGRPEQIVVEVTRDLKLSRKRKQEIEKLQASNQVRNEKHVAEACEVLGLLPDTLDRSKRRNLSQKMQLWYELDRNDVANRKCPFSGEQISIARLLSDEVEIEHILPFSRTLDDSMANKTVAMRSANRDKGNRTPWEAFGAAKVGQYNFQQILLRAQSLPKNKSFRFARDGYDRWLKEYDDFSARALNDTAYISKMAKEYLGSVVGDNSIWVVPGSLTAMIRGKLNLNSVLSAENRKNRDDHRHHAVDAAVIGITDRGFLQKVSRASANAETEMLDRLIKEMPVPWSNYREHVLRAVYSITVSFKPDHGYQGAMHEASAWGFRGEGVVSRRTTDWTADSPRKHHLKNKKLIPIRKTNDPHRHGVDDDGQPKAYKGYVGGSNYCIDIWENERGDWKGEVVTRYQAYQIIKKFGNDEGWRKLRNKSETVSGKPLIMRLMINDYLKLEVDRRIHIFRVCKINPNTQIVLAEHIESNVDSRNGSKDEPFSYLNKLPNPLKQMNAKQVFVSPAGVVRTSIKP